MTSEEQKNEKIQLNEIITINRGVSANVRAKLEECTFVGIDFGTSTTTVTRLVYDSDIQQVMSAPMMIAQVDASGVEIESHLVPTVVATTGGGRLIFGEGAKACLLNEETCAEGYNVWSEFKMFSVACGLEKLEELKRRPEFGDRDVDATPSSRR